MEGGPEYVVLLWKTRRPDLGGMRMSSYFRWRTQEMRLELEILCERCVKIRLRWRRQPPSSDSFWARSYLSPGSSRIFFGRIYFGSDTLESWTPEVPALTICTHQVFTNDEWLSFVKEEEWTVVCRLNFREVNEDRVDKETIHLSTVDGSFQPTSLSADQSVSQAGVPRDTEDLSRLLREELFPDFRLTCEGRTFRVHRGLLAVRSKYFRALFEHDMLEGRTGEAVIEHLQVTVLDQLLEFVYSGRLGEEVTDEGVVQLYGAADRFAVPSLSAACARRMLGGLSEGNCVAYLEKADLHSDPDLKGEAMSFLLRHPNVFRSDPWRAFSKRNPTLAVEVFQSYFTSMNP